MSLLHLVFLLLGNPTGNPEVAIGCVLDRFHQAASQANGQDYFQCLTPDAVFIGTDVTESWNRQEFESFCRPYFEKKQGWTYTPTQRTITLGKDTQTAWFVEILQNSSYGVCRGTGVLVKDGAEWKIAQYHLTIPIPNSLAKDIVALIRAESKTPDP